jgi:ABC-type multidrug transport system fused ATPase/permease subunit
VKKGEMLCIVGRSGAGKTTIVDLLLRLLQPEDGKILVDGIDIAEIDIRDWRKNIGYISQDTFVINGTIEENIRFYDERVSNEDIINAAKEAQIYDFIQNQPNQLKAEVGERGGMISGGEKQRLALARQLARKTKILIMDEATNALDNRSEVLIQGSIEALKGKMTIFIIAHRLSTLIKGDRVIFLQDGSIKEQGAPKELLKNKESYFYRLYNTRNNAQ